MSHRVQSEYGVLKKVLLARPEYLQIMKPINVIQEKHAQKNIDSALACKEHDEFIEVLEKEGVEVILEDTHERFPYAVNTRDLGVTTPKGIVFGRFTSPYRWGERRLVEEPFKKKQIYPYETHSSGRFEGGDFMYIDEKKVAIGIGTRTDLNGVRQLQNTFDSLDVEFITVDFDEEYLHLDMIMNVIGEKTAVICEEALPAHIVQTLIDKDFTLIKVTREDVFLHKCNLLSIGNNTIISHSQATDVSQKLESLGFKVIQLSFREALKSGGGPRCMSFPLCRE